MTFSGSGATDDSCSHQCNSTVLQAYTAARTSRQLQLLPYSGSYLLDAGMGSLFPVKPAHLTPPQALKLPQRPHVSINFGALSLRNCRSAAGRTGDPPYLQKNECHKEKLQLPSHSWGDRISEQGCSHALIGLGTATASKSRCLLRISRFQGVSGCMLYSPTAEMEYFII